MKQSDDQTLFAWQLGFEVTKDDICGPLATSPSQFLGASDLLPIPDSDTQIPYSMTNKGLRIELPIVHQGSERYGMAILQCSTVRSYPKQIALPVVCVGQQGSNHYARDGRYIGPLNAVDLDFAAKAVCKTMFMKQEPEQNRQWRTGLPVRIWTRRDNLFRPIYWNTGVVALGRDLEGRDEHDVPSSCRRGAILFAGRDKSHILVLFNIEMQHIGRYG